MTTPEAIYRTALEHIRDGSDAVCTQCGWMGDAVDSLHQERCETFFFCPKCRSKDLNFGINEIATYALAQGEKGE